MKKIPNKVLVACAFCVACMVLGGTIRLATPEMKPATQLIAWLGITAVAVETFSWGARVGYPIPGQSLGIQIERVLRCATMSGIMTLLAIIAACPVLQVIFETFFRK